MIIEFEFKTQADGVGEAQLDAERYLAKHILDDEGTNSIHYKKFDVGKDSW